MQTQFDYYLPSELQKRFRINNCLNIESSIEQYVVYDFVKEIECELCLIYGMENCTYAKIMNLIKNDFETGPVKKVDEVQYYRNRRLLYYTHALELHAIKTVSEINLQQLFSKLYYILEWNNELHLYTIEEIRKNITNIDGDICLSNWIPAVWNSDVKEGKTGSYSILSESLKLLIWFLDNHETDYSVVCSQLNKIFEENPNTFTKERIWERLGKIQQDLM